MESYSHQSEQAHITAAAVTALPGMIYMLSYIYNLHPLMYVYNDMLSCAMLCKQRIIQVYLYMLYIISLYSACLYDTNSWITYKILESYIRWMEMARY